MAVCKEERPFYLFLGDAVFFIFAQGNLIADQSGDDIPLGEIAVNSFVHIQQAFFQTHTFVQGIHTAICIAVQNFFQIQQDFCDLAFQFFYVCRDFIGQGHVAFLYIFHGAHEHQEERTDGLLIDIICREIFYFFF